MQIYAHKDVLAVHDFHRNILLEKRHAISVKDYLKQYALDLKRGFVDRSSAVFTDISNYYKPLIGKDSKLVFSQQLSDKEFLDIAASVHGFKIFSAVSEDLEFDHCFEKSVDYLLAGNIQRLEGLLKENATLVNMHSPFGHKAQLIHYCASNAVEIYRQVVPKNLLDVIIILIHYGADPKTKIPVYGGMFDFFDLFFTSAHPKATGLDEEVSRFFQR